MSQHVVAAGPLCRRSETTAATPRDVPLTRGTAECQRLACAELDVGCLTRLAQHPRVGALAEGLERTGVRGSDVLGRARGVGPLAREPLHHPTGDVGVLKREAAVRA